jgi:hypothetical protein
VIKPLSPHQHSGRYLPRQHTSHAVLAFLLLIAGTLLLLATRGVLADQADISAVVHGSVPSQAPIITNPASGQHFTLTPITVEGSCIAGYKVVLYDNGALAGSAICRPDGTFNIKNDLIIGRNELMARQYDGLDQPSPDSNIVVVYLDRTLPPIVPVTPGGSSAQQQFVIRSDTPYKVGRPSDVFDWPFSVIGGQPPYAISINWGDGTTDVISITSPGSFHAKHSYDSPGNYHLIIKGSDSKGQTAYLELLAVINGDVGVATASSTGFIDGGILLVLWPLYILMFIMLLSFWLGERIELYKVKQELLRHPGELI